MFGFTNQTKEAVLNLPTQHLAQDLIIDLAGFDEFIDQAHCFFKRRFWRDVDHVVSARSTPVAPAQTKKRSRKRFLFLKLAGPQKGMIFKSRRSRSNKEEIAQAVSFSLSSRAPIRGRYSNPVAPTFF